MLKCFNCIRLKKYIREKKYINYETLLVRRARPDLTKQVRKIQKDSMENKELSTIKIQSVRKIIKLNKSKNIFHLLLYLMLVSENRTNEILHYLMADGYYIKNKKI